MSKIRLGTCREPGPHEAHCTEPVYHRMAHYDVVDDVVWSWRSENEWDRHDNPCDDPRCDYNTGILTR